MRGTMSRRLSSLLLTSASVAALSLAWAPSPALAFYNQRINTSGSGVVQVLLVDGSTFTVGTGSDLVIDKFVYDPKKNKGEIVATFGKGVLRFVGGKISKNEGGVKVN